MSLIPEGFEFLCSKLEEQEGHAVPPQLQPPASEKLLKQLFAQFEEAVAVHNTAITADNDPEGHKALSQGETNSNDGPIENRWSESRDYIAALLFPEFQLQLTEIKNQNPSWELPELLEDLRPVMNRRLDDFFSSSIQNTMISAGAIGTYIEALYQNTTLYQPDKMPEERIYSAEENQDRRIEWFRSTQITTTALNWGILSEEQKMVHLNALVAVLDWRCTNKAYKEIRAQADNQQKGIQQRKHDALIAGATIVLGRWTEAQKHRFGKDWATDKNNKSIKLAPNSLLWADMWTWFADETRKAAEAIVLDKPYPMSGSGDVLHKSGVVRVAIDVEQDGNNNLIDSSGEAQLIALLDQSEAAALFNLLEKDLTKREAETLRMQVNGDDDEAIAQAMNISASTVRVNKANIRKKAVNMATRKI